MSSHNPEGRRAVCHLELKDRIFVWLRVPDGTNYIPTQKFLKRLHSGYFFQTSL